MHFRIRGFSSVSPPSLQGSFFFFFQDWIVLEQGLLALVLTNTQAHRVKAAGTEEAHADAFRLNLMRNSSPQHRWILPRLMAK